MSTTETARKRDPLEGKTLAAILQELVDVYGWEQMGREIRINCFLHEPTMASSLKLLRRTPWARAQVEDMYRYYVTHERETLESK